MAPTRIADVIVPEVFNAYVSQRSVELSRLVQSGVIQNSPELNALAASGGTIVNMPFWNDLTGDDEVLSDTTALTPQNITSGQDKARLLLRGKAWASNDLAAALAGDDPMGEIASKVASFWVRQRQKALLSILSGVFGAASMSANVLDISAATGPANIISANTFIDATQKLGDHKDQVTAIMMHSAVEAHLAKADLIDYERDSQGSILVRRYLGIEVIVDDALTADTGVYTSYIFGPGAIGLGNGAAPVPTEVDRDSLAGDDILVNRQHFILHPRGVAWQEDTVVGSSPTNAELATSDNWVRVYDPKQIRIVQFKYELV